MKLTAFTLIGALGIGALGLAATTVSARAAPVVPTLDVHQASGIVQVWGGCGPGARPVPGHWSPLRGVWIPPHCAPAYSGGGYPYWHHRSYRRWGY